MNIVFMGTPSFAAITLENLIQQHNVVAVFTRPDAVRGRGKTKEASPVKETALRNSIPIFEASSLRDEKIIEQIKLINPDIICVAAYGAILPKEVLDAPLYGCLNVHASLLPRWRGSAPIERAILSGDIQTGVCVMRMEEGLDTGDYCICRTTDIDDKNLSELTDELADLGSQALLVALMHIEKAAIEWIVQDEESAIYAQKIEKHELNIVPADTALRATRKVRASSVAHPSRCTLAGRGVTLLQVREVVPDENSPILELGEASFVNKRLLLGLGEGICEVLRIKPDGKRPMDALSFMLGMREIKNTFYWGGLDV